MVYSKAFVLVFHEGSSRLLLRVACLQHSCTFLVLLAKGEAAVGSGVVGTVGGVEHAAEACSGRFFAFRTEVRRGRHLLLHRLHGAELRDRCRRPGCTKKWHGIHIIFVTNPVNCFPSLRCYHLPLT